MTLTNKKFFVLLLIAHLAFFYIMLFSSWVNLIITFFIFCFITLFSSTVIYHRFLSHRSWNSPRWYEIFATILGIFSFTGTPITRTLAHRYHHAYVDTDKDPHSPRQLNFFFVYFPMLKERKLNPILVRDLLSDSFHVFIHNNYLKIIISTWVLSLLLFGPVWTVTLFVAPGALCWFNIFLCNFFCHSGKDEEKIKQSKFLALLTFGEGYHRYHHDNPTDPNFGDGKFDIGCYIIKLVKRIDSMFNFFYNPRT